jgi:hypothetical protein
MPSQKHFPSEVQQPLGHATPSGQVSQQTPRFVLQFPPQHSEFALQAEPPGVHAHLLSAAHFPEQQLSFLTQGLPCNGEQIFPFTMQLPNLSQQSPHSAAFSGGQA